LRVLQEMGKTKKLPGGGLAVGSARGGDDEFTKLEARLKADKRAKELKDKYEKAAEANKATEQDLKAAFALFDINGDKMLSKDELSSILTRPTPGREPISHQDAEKLFLKMDHDRNGKVSYDEFAHAWAQKGGRKLLGAAAMAKRRGDERYVKTDALFELVCEGANGTTPVRLLRSDWLIETAYGRPQNLPLRQTLEAKQPEAFADAALLKRCLREVEEVDSSDPHMSFPGVVVLSYAWETPQHPDPRGTLLEQLAPVLEWYTAERAFRSQLVKSARGVQDYETFCVFIDFWSLYQGAERTPEQLAAFELSLGSMDVWYGHIGTCTLCMTEMPPDSEVDRTYASRGWTFFERMVSSLGKKPALCLDGGRFGRRFNGAFAQKSKEDLQEEAEGNGRIDRAGSTLETLVQGFRTPPCTPQEFRALLAPKQFTKETDRDVVCALFTKVCLAVLGAIENMACSRVRWTAEQYGGLADALKLATSMTSLELSDLHMDGEMAAAFFGRLGKRDLPRVKSLSLRQNDLGDKGVAALAAAAERKALPNLEQLDLRRNAIGDAGMKRLATAVSKGAFSAAIDQNSINTLENPGNRVPVKDALGKRERKNQKGKWVSKSFA